MPGNTIGQIYRLTSFGESHGKYIGGVIDGCPPGVKIDINLINRELVRRMPGQSEITSQRDEEDKVEIISGIFEGKTTGAPIAFLVKNKDIKEGDYELIKEIYRPSHADYTYEKKYGIRDYRGSGRASARETVARVVAGTIARQILSCINVKIYAFVSQIGNIILKKDYSELDLMEIENNIVRCPDAQTAKKMIKEIKKIKEQGDSIGSVISCVIKNTPPGLGEPVFDKLHAGLAKAMVSINGVRGFEIGAGFKSARMRGSEHNDPFYMKKNKVTTITNYSAGIQGGISNGEDIYFRVVFKPPSSIALPQQTVDTRGKSHIIELKSGRYDSCIAVRAVPIVEAMTAICILDFYLLNKIYKK